VGRPRPVRACRLVGPALVLEKKAAQEGQRDRHGARLHLLPVGSRRLAQAAKRVGRAECHRTVITFDPKRRQSPTCRSEDLGTRKQKC